MVGPVEFCLVTEMTLKALKYRPIGGRYFHSQAHSQPTKSGLAGFCGFQCSGTSFVGVHVLVEEAVSPTNRPFAVALGIERKPMRGAKFAR